MKKILILIIGFVCFNVSLSLAQSGGMDSMLILIKTLNAPNPSDSTILWHAISKMENGALSDKDYELIKNETKRLLDLKNEEMAFLIDVILLVNDTNRSRAIDDAKVAIDRIEKSDLPDRSIVRNIMLTYLRIPFRNSDRLDEGLIYYNNWIGKLKLENDSSGIAGCNYVLSGFYRAIGLPDRGIYHLKNSQAYLDSSDVVLHKFYGISQFEGKTYWTINLGILAELYALKNDFDNGTKYARKAFEMRSSQTGIGDISFAANLLGNMYLHNEKLDSASYMFQLAYDSTITLDYGLSLVPSIYQNRARLEIKRKNFDLADSLLVEAWKIIKQLNISANSPSGVTEPDYYRALIRMEQGKYSEAAEFLLADISRVKNLRTETLRDYKLLAEVYEKLGEIEKANEAYKAFISLQEILFSDQAKYNSISFEAEQRMNQGELDITKLKNENKVSSIVRNFSFGIAAILLVLAGVIFYRFRSKQKDNSILKNTLNALKQTQNQLVQSEKMASLGELTAGIAHEIQNPLNFVNNFSEVSNELIDEMNQELEKGEYDEAKAIAKDVKQNLEKINHHGKRADSIVKGMLQHSRNNSGQKESTDINVLCDEYLRLSYHGLRAKDSTFNATIKTDFDSSIGKVDVIPQDIGRVFLNLFNNAFYAVNERKRKTTGIFEPTVSVGTKRIADKVEIRITDNGGGIPAHIVDKIFQPFFTTKPTGQGTGLGLSLSYDIITKGHGGELTVTTQSNEGSEFIIILTGI